MLSLGKKLVLSHLLLVVLGILVTGWLGYRSGAESLRASYLASLRGTARQRVEKLELLVQAARAEVRLAQGYYNVRRNLKVLAGASGEPLDPAYREALKMLDGQISAYRRQERYRDFLLADRQGRVVYSLDPQRRRRLLGRPLPEAWQAAFQLGSKRVCVVDTVVPTAEGFRLVWLAAGPAEDLEGRFQGVIFLELNQSTVFRSLLNRTGLGETGEAVIARRIDKGMLFLHPLRHGPHDRLLVRSLVGEAARPMRLALEGQTGAGEGPDYRNKPVLAAWLPVARMGWGLVVKLDAAEARRPAMGLLRQLVVAGFVGLALALVLATGLTRTITRPLREVACAAELITSGELGVRAAVSGSDEVARMGTCFNRMADSLIATNRQLEAQNEALNRVGILSMTDAEGRLRAVNERFCRTAGYTEEELLGQTHNHLNSGHHAPEFWQDLWETIASGHVWRGEIRNQSKDGRHFWVDTSIAPILDEQGRPHSFIAISFDVTLRREAAEQIKALNEELQRWAERELHQREAQLQAVLQNVPEAVLIYGRDGKIQSANSAVEGLFGWAPEALIGAPVDRLFEVRMVGRLPAPGFHEGRGLRLDGGTFEIEVTAGRVPDGGEEHIAIARDVTERKQMIRKLAEQEHLAQLGRLAAVVAHEVKNPLAGFRGAIDVIGRRLPEDSPDRAMIPEIISRIDSLNDTVQDLLLFARPRSPRLVPTSPRRIFEESVQLLRSDPLFADVRILIDGDERTVPVDSDLLKPVFHNLLLNAAQALSGEGEVRVRVAFEQGACRIEVADDGPGISEEVRERIFEPFVTTKTRGTGLGLSVARRVVESHRGRIWIEQPEAGGTTVCIELPVEEQGSSGRVARELRV